MSVNDNNPHLILPVGTQVVALVDVRGPDGKPAHPRGAAGEIVQAPADAWHAYRVRFPGGLEAALGRRELAVLSHYTAGAMNVDVAAAAAAAGPLGEYKLFDHVIFRCVVGSRAYGLDSDASAT